MDELSPGNGTYHQLRYALARSKGKGIRTEIDEYYPYLAAIVGVYRAGTVKAGDAVRGGKAGARPYLRFVSGGQLHADARGHHRALSGGQQQGLIQIGPQVRAGSSGSLIMRRASAVLYDYRHLEFVHTDTS
jgi:hypothetical protein